MGLFLPSFLKWIGLFLGAVGIAIALAHGLNSPSTQQPSSPTLTQIEAPAGEVELAIQERYGRQWLHYATVSRSDDSFRQMFIAARDGSRVEAEQPLPDSTLMLMETWYSASAPGAVFIKQKLDGRWQYGSFSPSAPDYRVSDRQSCHRCHTPFPETDFTLTKPLLEAALYRQQVQTAHCDRPGRSPCAPEAYLPETL